ncbi:hypothetical protein QMZ05_21890 [Bradyrhizobium sp. INPA03-11B]
MRKVSAEVFRLLELALNDDEDALLVPKMLKIGNSAKAESRDYLY